MHVHNAAIIMQIIVALRSCNKIVKKILGIAKNQGVSVASELPLKRERYKEWAKSLREI